MKKLLLTIFTIATLVACNKDAFDQEITNINVLEQAEEINASVDSSDQLDAAFDFINSLNDAVNSGEIEVTPKSTKGNASTAKAGDFGGNWIQLLFFDYTFIPTFGERQYAFVRSNNYDVLCADTREDASSSFDDVMLRPTETSYSLRDHSNPNLARVGRSELIIEMIDVNGVAASGTPLTVVTADWQTTFNADFNRIFAAAADRSGIIGGGAPPVSRFDVSCDEWSTDSTNGIGMYVNPVRPNDNFEVMAAPFPLSGFLARHINLDAGDLNYAGTDLNGANGVKAAIEANIKR